MKLLRSNLQGLPRVLPMLKHDAPDQVVARPNGSTLAAIRRRVLARSGQRCECDECSASGYPLALTWDTFEADHITPLYLGGTNALSNFRALHIDCHARITAAQAAARAQAQRTWTDRVE